MITVRARTARTAGIKDRSRVSGKATQGRRVVGGEVAGRLRDGLDGTLRAY